MPNVSLKLLGGMLLVLASGSAWAGEEREAGGTRPGVEFFESKVRPVLVERCYSCHSSAAEKLKGKLRLDSMQGMRRGGESGSAAVTPGKVDDSLMVAAVRYELDELHMPPKK